MIKTLEKLLNLIYIRECYFCGSQKEDLLICSNCRSKIHTLPKGELKNINGVNAYSCCLYDGVIKKLIIGLKYNGKKQLAELMAEIMYEYWKDINTLNNEYVVLPVPIHKSRKKERKYNHMDITGKEFCRLTHYKLNNNFLVRIKDTKKQYQLNKQARAENIKNAFDLNLNNAPKKSQSLLIIDDITSTGITLSEIIKILHKNGYKNIIALTLATPDIWN